jgi:hypothetical protein
MMLHYYVIRSFGLGIQNTFLVVMVGVVVMSAHSNSLLREILFQTEKARMVNMLHFIGGQQAFCILEREDMPRKSCHNLMPPESRFAKKETQAHLLDEHQHPSLALHFFNTRIARTIVF